MENPLPGHLPVSEGRSLPPRVLRGTLKDHLVRGASEESKLQRRALLFSKMLVSSPPSPASNAPCAPRLRLGLPGAVRV